MTMVALLVVVAGLAWVALVTPVSRPGRIVASGDAPRDLEGDVRRATRSRLSRWQVLVVAAAAGSWFAGSLLPMALAMSAAVVMRRRRSRLRQDHDRLVDKSVPSMAVLFAAALQSGHGVVGAARRLAPLIGEPLAEPLTAFVQRIDLGASRGEALDGLARDLGTAGIDLVDALRANVDDGAAVVATLHRLADRLRVERRHRTEAALRRLPVLLLLPLVCCVLPAFVLLTVAPAVIETVSRLAP